ncbi:hypothetical protein MTO96_042403 [Rhipicephalus appendiculatus]
MKGGQLGGMRRKHISLHSLPKPHGSLRRVWRTGDQADVCPKVGCKWCRGWGTTCTPTNDHRCDPMCPLCGDPHPTAAKKCRDEFQVPYIARRRLRQRRQRAEQVQLVQQLRDSTNFSTAGGMSCSRSAGEQHR